MLDAQLLEQLKSVFLTLDQNVELVYKQSSHPDQAQLIELLQSVASTNQKISVRASDDRGSSESPEFYIEYQGKHTGITFKGIPGGHEFTTLIVGILNTNGKGKFPDAMIQNRIKKIKGPIHLKSFISLSCENCPDVVQSLNQIALIHGNFQHEMIDGGYYQNEIERLGIQGVPSLIVDDRLIHSGRIQLLDLVSLLEKTFGVEESKIQMPSGQDLNLGHYDVVVIGGGPAGVSAAIYSVRKGLKTALLTDKVGGQVQETKGIENLISIPYTEGPQLAANLSEHLSAYPIQILEYRRVKKIDQDKVKTIVLESGEKLTTDAVIVATGAKWKELGIPGEKEYIGRGVAFCPHCDGPYYKNKKVAVIGGGNSGVEAAIDLAGIVKEVVLFEYNDQLKADQILIDKLKSLSNVSIITSAKTDLIVGDGQKVTHLQYFDRQNEKEIKIDLDGIFIQIGLVPNSQFLKGTVEMTKFGEVIVDQKGHTSVPGIYAAGDVTTTPFKQIIIAMGEGAKAALAAFEDRMLIAHK